MTTAAKSVPQLPMGKVTYFSLEHPLAILVGPNGDALQYDVRSGQWKAATKPSSSIASGHVDLNIDWRGHFATTGDPTTKPGFELAWGGEPHRNFIMPTTTAANRGAGILYKGQTYFSAPSGAVYGASVVLDGSGVAHIVVVTATSSTVLFSRAVLSDFTAGAPTWTTLATYATSALFPRSEFPHSSFFFDETGLKCVQVHHDTVVEGDTISSYGTFVTEFTISADLASVSYTQTQHAADYTTSTTVNNDTQTTIGRTVTDSNGDSRSYDSAPNGVQSTVTNTAISSADMPVGADYVGSTLQLVEVSVNSTVKEEDFTFETITEDFPTEDSGYQFFPISNSAILEATSAEEVYTRITSLRVNSLKVGGVTVLSYTTEGDATSDNTIVEHSIKMRFDTAPASETDPGAVNSPSGWVFVYHDYAEPITSISTSNVIKQGGSSVTLNKVSEQFADVLFVDARYGVAAGREHEYLGEDAAFNQLYGVTHHVHPDYVGSQFVINDGSGDRRLPLMVFVPVVQAIPGNVQMPVMWHATERVGESARQWDCYGWEPPILRDGGTLGIVDYGTFSGAAPALGITLRTGAWAVSFYEELRLKGGQDGKVLLEDAGLSYDDAPGEAQIELALAQSKTTAA